MTTKKKRIIILIAAAAVALWAYFNANNAKEVWAPVKLEATNFVQTYVQNNAQKYEKELGPLQAVNGAECARLYTTYPTLMDAWNNNKDKGSIMANCQVYAEFAKGHATIKIIMNKPEDNSRSWYIQKQELVQ